MSVSLNGIHGARKTIAGGSHHMERATHNAGQEICWRFNFLAGATRGQSTILPTGAGSQADVESTPPRPGHALHQWPCDLQRTHTTPRPTSSHHSTTSELTPLYDQQAHTTLRPVSSHHSTTSEITPLYDQWTHSTLQHSKITPSCNVST